MISPGADLACGTEPGRVEHEKTLQPAPPSGGPELDGRKDVLSSAGLGQLHAKLLTVTSTGDYPLDENDELALLRLVEERMAQQDLPIVRHDFITHSGWAIRPTNEGADAFWKRWSENGQTHRHGYYESTWGAINAALNASIPAPPAVKGV